MKAGGRWVKNTSKMQSMIMNTVLHICKGCTHLATFDTICLVLCPWWDKFVNASVTPSKLLDQNYENKRSKTHKKLKERFLIGRNRTKRANFWGSPLFQVTYHKKTINSTYLVSVSCSEAGSFCHKVSWIVWFSVFLLYVAWKRRFPRKFARFVLFRPIKKRSFNLLCVLDLCKPNPNPNLKP